MFEAYWFIGINPIGSVHMNVIKTLDDLDTMVCSVWVKMFTFRGYGIYYYYGKDTKESDETI